MGFIKRLFGIKEEEKVILDDVLVQPEPTIIFSGHVCEACNQPIPEGDVRTINNQKFHIKCLRRLRKEAKRNAFRL